MTLPILEVSSKCHREKVTIFPYFLFFFIIFIIK